MNLYSDKELRVNFGGIKQNDNPKRAWDGDKYVDAEIWAFPVDKVSFNRWNGRINAKANSYDESSYTKYDENEIMGYLKTVDETAYARLRKNIESIQEQQVPGIVVIYEDKSSKTLHLIAADGNLRLTCLKDLTAKGKTGFDYFLAKVIKRKNIDLPTIKRIEFKAQHSEMDRTPYKAVNLTFDIYDMSTINGKTVKEIAKMGDFTEREVNQQISCANYYLSFLDHIGKSNQKWIIETLKPDATVKELAQSPKIAKKLNKSDIEPHTLMYIFLRDAGDKARLIRDSLGTKNGKENEFYTNDKIKKEVVSYMGKVGKELKEALDKCKDASGMKVCLIEFQKRNENLKNMHEIFDICLEEHNDNGSKVNVDREIKKMKNSSEKLLELDDEMFSESRKAKVREIKTKLNDL